MNKTYSFEYYTQQAFANTSNQFIPTSKPINQSQSFIQAPPNKVRNNYSHNNNQYQYQHQQQQLYPPTLDDDNGITSFQFHQNFSINMVDEDEDVIEEKMHSPRTPYGSVPDPSKINKMDNNNQQIRQQQYLAPPQPTYGHLGTMERTISFESMQSCKSFSYNSNDAAPGVMSMDPQISYSGTGYNLAEPPLSATSSINLHLNKGLYSNVTSPDVSPPGTPVANSNINKWGNLNIHQSSSLQSNISSNSTIQTIASPNSSPLQSRPTSATSYNSDHVNGNRKQAFDFGDRKRDRNASIEEIHKQLTQLQKTNNNNNNNLNMNDFNRYKHGLGTYSGVNTNGSVTPASINGLSRSSSCNSLGVNGCGSDCSSGYQPDVIINDNVHDHNDNDNDDDDGLTSGSGNSTPTVQPSDYFDPNIASPNSTISSLNQNKIQQDISEDEDMETPVPTSTICKNNDDNDDSPFGFVFEKSLKCIPLAEIAEDDEMQNTSSKTGKGTGTAAAIGIATTAMIKKLSTIKQQRDDNKDRDDMKFGIIDDDLDSDCSVDEPLPTATDYNSDDLDVLDDLEHEIYIKGSRFQSSSVLFLDVDGVLLTSSEQQLLKSGEIKFNDCVTSLLCKLYTETHCDIVISSTWQFHVNTHLNYLIQYLIACGWNKNKIHTLMELLPSTTYKNDVNKREWYESSPYCRCRARGIQEIVKLYGDKIDRWCCLDDLPLDSCKYVCIPKEKDIDNIVNQLSEAYFKSFEYKYRQYKSQLMQNIKYYVKYCTTILPNSLFCEQSFRFGYEYNETMIYYQADAIAKMIKLTNEIKDNQTYLLLIQNLMAIMKQYIASNLTFQGNPDIKPFLIQTDQQIGITQQNIDNVITMLTYNKQQLQLQLQQLQPLGLKLNDANIITV